MTADGIGCFEPDESFVTANVLRDPFFLVRSTHIIFGAAEATGGP